MATCKSCGASVGCGCQLREGLCAYCYDKLKQATKKVKHVITQAYKLL